MKIYMPAWQGTSGILHMLDGSDRERFIACFDEGKWECGVEWIVEEELDVFFTEADAQAAHRHPSSGRYSVIEIDLGDVS